MSIALIKADQLQTFNNDEPSTKRLDTPLRQDEDDEQAPTPNKNDDDSREEE
ncbi:MAG TPA: hypothetical protein VFB59_05970 [Candidatus Saccharimonadales bacterium]|nr:hypothetical protein [Candidatus Saccharimonadales bacterium]